ncbi:hypothetical protein [Jiangella alba]|uniref:hypothetical protein n=1 Tax=Jiangella alba TaxID=561176 RepID=UPI00114CE4CD|nr:hypothetical protein [Jiangella alba]
MAPILSHGRVDRASAQEHPRFHAMVHAGPAGAWWGGRSAAEQGDHDPAAMLAKRLDRDALIPR